MSGFSELIKNFDKIRDYMRDFYVYGFKSRDQFTKKSARSYDNEKRRIESYLSEYMSFNQNAEGKNVFISVDSGDIPNNPLYRAFKTKTFTKNDITLNFIILDILENNRSMTASEIADEIASDYLCDFENPVILDISTVRNKLNEYVKLGLFIAKKDKKKLVYSVADNGICCDDLCDSIMFFSEICPLGVVGSYLLDKTDYRNELFSFKHHYIMHALESEVLYELLEAVGEKKIIELSYHSTKDKSQQDMKVNLVPLKILISVQGGRRYLAGYHINANRFQTYRLDAIKSVKLLEPAEKFDLLREKLAGIIEKTWGVSFGEAIELQHLEMKLHIDEASTHIIHRINREGRHGTLSKIEENTYLYAIDAFDCAEMLPWLRTFTGRILTLECTNAFVVNRFYQDLDKVYEIYGGDSGAF